MQRIWHAVASTKSTSMMEHSFPYRRTSGLALDASWYEKQFLSRLHEDIGDQSASLPEEDIETGVFWQLSLSQKSIFGNVTATKQWRSVKLEQFFAFSEVGVNPGTIRWQFAKFAENHRDWLGYEPEIFDVRLLRTDLTFIYYWSSFVSRAAPRGECMGCHGNSFCRRTLLFCFIQCAWLFSLSFVLVSTLHRRWRIWRIADVPRSF